MRRCRNASRTIFAAAITTRADRGNPERPRLSRPARFGDTDTPQRPRPVTPGPQLASESIEELAHPATLDRLNGQTVDAGRCAVSTDLAPTP